MIPWNTLHTLGQLLEDGELDEIEIEDKDRRIRLNRTENQTQTVGIEPEPSPEPSSEEESTSSDRDDWITIESPMVGTFYKAPAPDADPFVQVGDEVSDGTTVCIIEAMKLMNEIEAETDGVIKEVCKDNAEPVSKGEDLFFLEPS